MTELENLKSLNGENINSDSEDKVCQNTNDFETKAQCLKSSEEEYFHCGIGSFRPKWLQKYGTPRSYLILFSLLGVVHSSTFAYSISIMTTLEKRYVLNSKFFGIMMTSGELVPLLFAIPFGYLGGKMHRPRVVAAGMILNAFCCYLQAFPYLVYGSSKQLAIRISANETKTELCDSSMEQDACSVDEGSPTLVAVVCLLTASLLNGVGGVAYNIIGLTYMDDNSDKKNTPIYLAFIECLRLFGPTVGYFLSSGLLKYYENPFEDPGYGPEDPRWIGAWWIGFVITGTLLLLFSLPLMLFPRALPQMKKSNAGNIPKQSISEIVTGLFKALKRMFTNPIYLSFVIGTIFNALGQFGHGILLPKYMEIQFHYTASEASLLSGPPSFVMMQLTILTGGLIIWKWKPSPRQILAAQSATEFIWGLGIFSLLFVSCEQFEMKGTRLTSSGLTVQNECNADCFCTTASFSPVCGRDGVSQYFSPCHAGCTVSGTSNNTAFEDCKCLFDDNGQIDNSSSGVKSGFCKSDGCWNKSMVYIVIYAFSSSMTISLLVAQVMILMRSVVPEDKSLSLGLFDSVFCICAIIPNPMIYTALADASCLIWESSCGETGNCWFYDVNRLKYLTHSFTIASAILSTCSYLVSTCISHKLKDLYREDA